MTPRACARNSPQRRIKAVIPPNPTRKHPHRYDKNAYKGRNVIERMFCRLKDFRRIATRYDKRADNYPLRNPLGRSPNLVDQLSPDPRAFSSEVDTGSREENASRQES